MKKLLYSMLVAAMVLGFGVGAFGAVGAIAPVPFTDIAGHAAEAELTLMASLGIFTGDSGLGGTVNPNGFITRAQFCKVIVLATGKGSLAAGLAGFTPSFTDAVPAWAWGYVNTAYFMKVISGYPDGSFKANDPVSYGEAVTMLVKAIPQHLLQVPAFSWPYNYIFYALEKGFIGAVDVGAGTTDCTRGDMARMLFATMQVQPVDAKGADTGLPILKLDERLHTGTFEQFDGAKIHVTGTHGADIDAAASVYLVGATSWTQLINQPVLVVESAAEKAVFVQKTEGTVLAGKYKSHDQDTGGDYYIKLADGTKVYYAVEDDYVAANVNINTKDKRWTGSAEGTVYTEEDLVLGDELSFNLDDDGFAVKVFAFRWDLVNIPPASPVIPYWDILADAHDKATGTTYATVDFIANSNFYYRDYEDQVYGQDLDGLVARIPDTATVTINGVAAISNDLKKNDVIKAATRGAWGYDFATYANPIIALSAERVTFQGTVTGKSTVYPGPIDYVTFSVGGTSTTYEIDAEAYLLWGDFTVGSTLYKLVVADGKLFQETNLGTTATPLVRIEAVRTVTEFDHHHHYTDVDNRGTKTTYEWHGTTPVEGHVGLFLELIIDNADGMVDSFNQATDQGQPHTVLAVSAGSVTLQCAAHLVTFLEDAYVPVYAMTAGPTYTYIGCAGLAVDDVVLVYSGAGGITFIVRDDRP